MSNFKFIALIVILNIYMSHNGISRADVYTSMVDVGKLLTTEGEMIRTVENYITAQEKKLQKLKSDLIEMERVHELATKSPDTFLANPLNSYLLIKRLTIDWADLQELLGGDTVGKTMLSNLTSVAGMLQFPDEEDLNGVALALMRLQDTYKLETSELAEGNIMGTKTAYRQLTAGDCFELGRQSYNSGDFYHTMLWMNEALSRHGREEVPTVDKFDILEYLAFSTYKEGNVNQALKLTNSLLDLQPNHTRARGNKDFYERAIDETRLAQRGEVGASGALGERREEQVNIVKEKSSPNDYWAEERATYERLCRGESRLSPKTKAKFACHYQHGPSAFLRVGPVKAEVVHIHPTIILYHNVIFDAEISAVKELAMPKFQRATVQNYKTGELETASYRISKSSWLRTEESPHVKTINDRIGAITGLNMETAEELQVANYGVGGHYEPHFDFARREEKDAFKNLGTGNRIATFLFYMTNVDAGGATVFPRLELSLYPSKGDAAFWFNLHPSGEGDVLTRHAACPVLVGQKWVSNKWIHERGQELIRPCMLNYDDLVVM